MSEVSAAVAPAAPAVAPVVAPAVPPPAAADPVVAEAHERIRQIQMAPRYFAKKQVAHASRRLPPPGHATRYFMSKSLDDIPVFEEVTFRAAEWHKAGTLMNLLQRQCVVAVPAVNIMSAGEPPTVPEATKPCPTLDVIVAGLVEHTGKSRSAVAGLAHRIHALEHEAWVCRVGPYGAAVNPALMARLQVLHDKLGAEVAALMPKKLSDPVWVEKVTAPVVGVGEVPAGELPAKPEQVKPPAEPAEPVPPPVPPAPAAPDKLAALRALLDGSKEPTKAQLVTALEAAGLPTEGSKTELLAAAKAAMG